MDKQPISVQAARTAPYSTRVKLLPLAILLALLSGCGSSFGPASAAPTATPTREYVAVPTFTPTPAGAAPTVELTVEPNIAVAAAPATFPVTPTVAVTTTSVVTTPVATPASAARLTVTGDAINIRSGPGTDFDSIGTAALGQSFPLLARNAQGDWWQVCCINEQPGWIFGALATVEGAENLAVAAEISAQPTSAALAAATIAPTPAPVADAPTTAPAEPTSAPAPLPPVATDSSAGDFNPDAHYQIVHYRVLGLNENNGGVRDSQAQHHIFLTVLDQAGNGIDGAVVENLVGEKGQTITGNKGPGKAEITMYYEPFKLRVATDGAGPVTSQTSNQMGLAFPHLPDIVGKLGDVNYEYGVCPTLEIKCTWPIQGIHFSYEITFQKVK